MEEGFGRKSCSDFKQLIGREDFGNAELEIVGGERRRPGRGGKFLRTIQGQDVMSAADLRLAEGSGFRFAEGAKLAGAAVDDFAGNLRFERSGFCSRTRRVRKNVEISERKRVNEKKSVFVIGFGFSGEADDDIGADSGVRKKFANEFDAAGVMLGTVPAVHGGEDIV